MLRSQELLHVLKKKRKRNYLKSWWTSPGGCRKIQRKENDLLLQACEEKENKIKDKIKSLSNLNAMIKHHRSDEKTISCGEGEMAAEG